MRPAAQDSKPASTGCDAASIMCRVFGPMVAKNVPEAQTALGENQLFEATPKTFRVPPSWPMSGAPSSPKRTGEPFSNTTRCTEYPKAGYRFHEPWRLTNASPSTSRGKEVQS